MKNIFSVFTFLFVSCLSFPLDHYSRFHRVQQQDTCESLAINTQRNVINTKGFMPVNVTNTWYENLLIFSFPNRLLTLIIKLFIYKVVLFLSGMIHVFYI